MKRGDKDEVMRMTRCFKGVLEGSDEGECPEGSDEGD